MVAKPRHCSASVNSNQNPFLRYEVYPIAYVKMIEAAIEQQSEIGWLNLIRGYMTKKWYLLASTYFSESAEGRNPRL
jgi:hypothetical protein